MPISARYRPRESAATEADGTLLAAVNQVAQRLPVPYMWDPFAEPDEGTVVRGEPGCGADLRDGQISQPRQNAASATPISYPIGM